MVFINKTSLKLVIGTGLNVKKREHRRNKAPREESPKGLGPFKAGILIFEQNVSLKEHFEKLSLFL